MAAAAPAASTPGTVAAAAVAAAATVAAAAAVEAVASVVNGLCWERLERRLDEGALSWPARGLPGFRGLLELRGLEGALRPSVRRHPT